MHGPTNIILGMRNLGLYWTTSSSIKMEAGTDATAIAQHAVIKIPEIARIGKPGVAFETSVFGELKGFFILACSRITVMMTQIEHKA